VLAATRARIKDIESTGRTTRILVVGRRGASALKFAGLNVAQALTDIDETTPYTRWNEVMDQIQAQFLSGDSTYVDVVSTRYKTKAQQEAKVSWLLPFRPDFRGAAAAAMAGGSLYKVEPTRAAFLEGALSLLFRSELTCLLVEALLSEQIQRSMAMRGASDSAEGVLKTLTRQYNRARQAQITAEMIEIIGGSQAVGGDD
jgi:F-type H+-transporting ATPase subunit gamma